MPSIGTKQLTLTLKMTTPLLVEMLVTVDNSALQEYTHLDDHFYYSTSLLILQCYLLVCWLTHLVPTATKYLMYSHLFPCKA